MSSNGCSAISAAKSPKSSTSSAVSSSSSLLSFRLVPLLRLVLVKYFFSRDFFEAQVYDCPAGTTAGTNPAILIMVAIGGQNFYQGLRFPFQFQRGLL
jgi:hypothetical protein